MIAAVVYGCARSNRLLGLMPQKVHHVRLTRRTIQKGGKIVEAPNEGSGTAGNFIGSPPARVAALLSGCPRAGRQQCDHSSSHHAVPLRVEAGSNGAPLPLAVPGRRGLGGDCRAA